MTTKPTVESGSRSSSPLVLPLSRRSRRKSVISMSSVSQNDREALSQALDQIHSTASQSDSLTTFNQYTAPPTSSAGNDGKGITSDLQGGLSGLYSRFKASVGGVKDLVGPVLVAGEGEAEENMTPISTTISRGKQNLQSTRHSSPSASIATTRSENERTAPTLRLHSPAGQGPRTVALENDEAGSAMARDLSSGPLAALKSSIHTTSSGKSAHPLAQAGTSTVLQPAVVEVNVNATKISDQNMRGLLPSPENMPDNSSKAKTRNSLNSRADKEMALGKVAGEGRLGAEPDARSGQRTRESDSRTSGDLESPFTASSFSTGSPWQDAPDKRLPRRMTRISELNGDTRDTISGAGFSDEDLISPKQIEPIALDGATNGPHDIPADTSNDSAVRSTSGSEVDRISTNAQETMSRNTLVPPRSQQLRNLPRFSLSRGSSTDTAGGSSVVTSRNNRSISGEGNEDDILTQSDAVPAKVALTTQAFGDSKGTNTVLSQIKSKVLSKEFWMRDENAKDCFYCGDLFSTFRRKHHCRTCGQIFDSKCTSLVSGRQFGQSGSIRVCKQCEKVINNYDDSSEFSEEENASGSGARARHGSKGAHDTSPARTLASHNSTIRDNDGIRNPFSPAAPTMGIPATRRIGDGSNRWTAVVEIDTDRRLPRPGSSRSLKSASLGGRQYPSAHKRHHSRNLLQRGFKNLSEEVAPFHRNPELEKSTTKRLPAFHSDSIIDPDLAAFLSDEDSSGEEQLSIMSALNTDGLGRSVDHDRNALSGLLASSKKSRSRLGDKSVGGVSIGNRDLDDARLGSISRNPKRRNLSISNNILLRPSPRNYRFSTASPAMSSHLQESFSSSALDLLSLPNHGMRMIRSSSMRGIDAPAVELNNASIQHVRRLLRQLLEDATVTNVRSWEKALMPILLQATDDVNPDVQNGDDIDIRHYVKLKKIPGGRPGDTSYVSGLVFTKNLALKSMPRSIANPNILILTFPLEYARHQRHFMSLEPVIAQEREFLQNLVHRIAALRPHLLLVQRNISGLALEFLEKAKIATAYNVKPSVLEAIARCSQSRIISSIDKLAIKSGQASKCASFYLKTYVHGGRKKTYMFFSGCPKELGCTVVLRGGDNLVLTKIKRIAEFMTYVVYNLKLETCLMRDEFALIPSYTGVGSMSPDKEPSRQTAHIPPSKHDRKTHAGSDGDGAPLRLDNTAGSAAVEAMDTNKTPSDTVMSSRSSNGTILEPDELQLPDDIPKPTFYIEMVEKHHTKILSASPFVKFMQPHLLMRAREQEQRLLYLKNLCDQDLAEARKEIDTSKPQKFVLIKPEMINENLVGNSKKLKEVLRAVHDAEYDKALHSYRTQKKQWEAYLAGNTNLFDPFAHQNIAVLYSVTCTVTTVPCSGPDVLALGFYNEHEVDEDFEADCTLGQYVEDLCLGANTVCTANGCERKMLEHHRQYVHGNSEVNVFVENHPCELRGLQDSILMWSICRICGKSTQVMPMSENTWKYSFGKYLELSFWSSELHARAGVCPHDLHREHVRYFGFKDVALRLQYDPIKLREISVPRTRITWHVASDLNFKNEVYTKAEERINKFMLSVKARIKSINIDSVVPEKADSCKLEIERLLKRATDEHHALIRKLQDKYMDSKYFEIIPLNRAIRATQEKVADWDTIFAEFDHNFFPSEKDIRRLATLQLKKIFLDRDDSATSLTTTDEGAETPPTSEGEWLERQSSDETKSISPQTRNMSPELAHDMLKSVVQNETEVDETPSHHQSAPSTSISVIESLSEQVHLTQADLEEVRHLDLAVHTAFGEQVSKPKPLAQLDTQPVSPTTMGDAPLVDSDKPRPLVIEAAPVASSERPALQDTSSTSTVRVSSIPRAMETKFRHIGKSGAPVVTRMQSQPSQIRRENTSTSSSSSTTVRRDFLSAHPVKNTGDPTTSSVTDHAIKHGEKRLSDRLGLGALKTTGQSMIPRSIASRRKESRVSTLAKHFEQLSREFEKERLRDRRQRAAKNKQARAYPIAASKPIVEVYRSVDDAVEEPDVSDEEYPQEELPPNNNTLSHTTPPTAAGSPTEIAARDKPYPAGGFGSPVAEDTAAEDTAAEYTETEETTQVASYTGSDAEDEGVKSEEEQSLIDDIRKMQDASGVLSSNEAQLDLKLNLPKHEKSSLMKMLTNFWAERSASGWQALEYPLHASDHVFADSDVIIREDEPSSLIAFALGSEDYMSKLQNIQEKSKDLKVNHNKTFVPDSLLTTEEQQRIECSLLQSTGTHLKYQFQEGSARMLCKIFYAEQFDAVRRKCGISHRIVESLSRCLKWDSKGGKTKSVFLKTLDDRLVLKSLSQIETQAFLHFAPAYFQLMAEALFHELPSIIAKMLGFYQIVIRNPVTGVEFNGFVLVMENLFYDRTLSKRFDLKGSMRNRRIESTGEQNEVLLDENMVEFVYQSPLFVREHSKRLIRSSIWNDTLFLARQGVMDYSLMVGIDDNKEELVIGIIDCIRTYTWDKKLETWLKDRGKNRPTVTSPKDYKNRFRGAMDRYVLQAPNCWHQFHTQQLEPHSSRRREQPTEVEGDEQEAEVPIEES